MPIPKKPKQKRSSMVAELEAEKLRQEQELLEERARNIERIKVEAKQRSLRIAILSDSIQSFENLLQKVREHKKTKRDEDEWQKYLKCEDLPNTKVPSEVRSFIYKWQQSLNDHWDEQINWWLKCDDRCLLTQASEVPDVRRKLLQKLREPIGKFYDRKLRLLVTVHNSLEETLRRGNISLTRYEDLLKIRDLLRETAFKFLNVLTFEALMHIDREMVSVNALMANYSFSTPDFIKFVWSFKDVPLPNYNNFKLIKMDPLNMNVTISNRFDLTSSSVRGLWFKHDFFSEFCPSFNLPKPMKFIDLSAAVNEEMTIKKLMTNKRLEAMRKEREAYELMMEEKRKEEEANMSKKKKDTKVVPRSKKIDKKSSKTKTKVKFEKPVEPPIVDETTYVNVEDEYLVYEDAKLQEDLKLYQSEYLGLSENEVNMRSFQVTNGIFKIECFERPLQTQEINSQMFLRLNEQPHIIKLQQFYHVYKPPQVAIKKDERKSQFDKKVVDAKQAALADLMKVEVKLNSKFFWWECPTVCRWETWQESEEFTALDPGKKSVNHPIEKVKREENSLFSAPDPKHYKRPKDIIDFDLTFPPKDVKLSELLKNYLLPTMPNDFEFFNDKIKAYEQKRREWLDALEIRKQQDINRMTDEEFREEFNRKFEMRAFRARSLFPVERCQFLNILENPEIAKSVRDARNNLHERPKKFDEEEADKTKPLKDEPLMLSELLQEVEAANTKLRPVFRDFVESNRSFSLASLINTTDLKDQTKVQKKRSQKKLRLSPGSKVSTRSFKPISTSDSKSSFASNKVSFAESTEDSKGIADSIDKNLSNSASKRRLKLMSQHRGKWSTEDIYETSYDEKTKTVTFFTGRLGSFAFATRKYSNFPLKTWEIWPEINETEKFVVFKVETPNVSIEFKITNDGYTYKIYFSKLLPPQEIKIPVKIFELKKNLSLLNLNLFPEVDACCYIDNHCNKHKPMEFHTYKSMAAYCLSHNFKWSVWNRWAHRRVAIFDSRMIFKKNFKTIMTTPLITASVNVCEKSTESDFVELDYEMEPMDQEFRPDLLNFLDDEVDKREHTANRQNFMMIWFVQALLMNIQPLSFSL